MPVLKIVRPGIKAEIGFDPNKDKGAKRKLSSAFTSACREKGWSLSKIAQTNSDNLEIQAFDISAEEFFTFFESWLTVTYHQAQQEAKTMKKVESF